jgi:hypothetical protein
MYKSLAVWAAGLLVLLGAWLSCSVHAGLGAGGAGAAGGVAR